MSFFETSAAGRRGLLKVAAVGAAGTAVLATPNVSRAQTVTLRFQSTWPQRDIFHEFAQDYVSRVNAMAGGRLRIELGRPATAPIAVVSRRASLDPGGRLVTEAVSPTLLVTCAAADAGRRAALADAGARVLVCGDDDVDLPLALDRLAELGLEQVLCEGGPQLLHAALLAGVVDELNLSMSPALVGAGPRLLEGALPGVVRSDLRQLLEEDGTLFARYAVTPGAR